MKSKSRLFYALAATVGILAGGAQAKDLEKPNVTLSIGTAVLQYIPLPIATNKGYFQDEGLEVTIQNFNAGGSKALQALVAGSSDAVVGYYQHTISMQAQNKDIRCVVLLNDSPAQSLSVRADLRQKVRTPADLAGMRIGITAFGSSAETLVQTIMSKSGVAADKYSLVPVGAGATVVAALEQKSVDASVTGDPATTLMEQRGIAFPLIDTNTVEETTAVYGGKMPAACLYLSNDFIEQNPKTVQALVNAFSRALKWMSKAPVEEIAAEVPEEYSGTDPALFLEVLKRTRGIFPENGRMEVGDLDRVLSVLKQTDPALKDAQIDLEKTFVNTFVDNARAK